ncbi:MAG TPA: hypothetical protein VG013_43345, partial [Gemmataceae bacterium]|nr:hypothetical protein [Gemmataceae bacterium]
EINAVIIAPEGDPVAYQRALKIIESRRDDIARLTKLAAYHAEMAQKYKLAASRPWRPIAPDPPEPK